MATAGATQPGSSNLQPQQLNINAQHLSRPRSPSSPQVLSRPTLSRRKTSSPSPVPSNYNGSEVRSPSPPKQQVILRSTSSRQQHSNGSLGSRPVHSMFSASQPQLNLEQLDVKLRSRSHTVSSHDQRNRWSTGPRESPDSSFNSGSIGRSYDLSLTKRSVEDLRPLPVPVAAPKVPPRRGSRLTTVPDRRHSEQIDKRHRETRSCEDILESVSTEELKLEMNIMPGHNEGHRNKNGGYATAQATLQAQQPYPTHSLSQSQPSPHQPGNVMYHADMESQLQSSQGENHTAISKDSNQNKEMFQANRDPVGVCMPHRNHTGCVSYANESEAISNYSRNPYLTSDQWTHPNDSQGIGNSVNQSVNTHYPAQQAQTCNPIIVANVSKEYYQRSPSMPIPHSSNTAELTNQSVPANSVYAPDTGLTSMTSQHSSPTPQPIDEVNDANLSMTSHTSCSPSSPSPQNYQAFQGNKSATAPHVPHYEIPISSPSSHMQEQVLQSSNDSIQNTVVVQSTHHSYRHELDHASNTQTSPPSSNNTTTQVHHSQPQDMLNTVHTSEAQQSGSTHYSLTQPVDTKPLRSPGGIEVQSHSVSKKAQAFAQAFSQWQYHGTTGTAKKKQGSTMKPNSRSDAKPPVKPKPAALMKGGTLSLKRDKNKSQKSPESNSKKKGGQKYVFKQSQSRTLLSRGRTASQVDPLTDVGMDTQYNNYTPLNQPHSGSSSDSTLRDDLKFTESQRGFSASGPSPNSYDYGSQMTPTGDATLTPSSSPEFYGPQGYTHGLQQPPAVQSINGEFPNTLQRPQVGEHSNVGAPSPNVHVQKYVHKGNQPTVPSEKSVMATNTSTLQPASQTHVKPPSPHPCASNSYSHLSTPANGHMSSVIPSELMPPSQLAPIAEVNLESEQSMSSLLSATEQTDLSQNKRTDRSMRTDDTSAKLISASQATSVNSSIGTDEDDGKLSPIVQRSTTLPSSYKRPKPYRFNTHKYQSIDIQEQEDKSTDDDGAFSLSSTKLSDFTSLNTSIFPKQVKVSSSLLYSSNKAKICQGDVLDLHFVRQTKVVIMTSNNGEEYIVPLNSAIRFALTYDPLDTGQLIHQGYHFKSIGELIATKEMPSVIVATEAYNDSKPQSSVEVGEVLVICGVLKQGQGRVLKVNSATHGRKFLEERCTANFSTRPEDTKLSLNDMFKASVRLPQQAVMYPPAGLQLPDALVNFPVMLKQFRVIKSVIATPVSPQTYPPTSSMVYDINLELEIEVQEHNEISDHQLIEMRAKTQQLYSSFEPARVIPFQTGRIRNQEQVTLLTNTDQRGKFLGIQLELPEWLGQMRISKAKLHSQRESLSLQSSQDETHQHLKHGSTLLPLNSSVSFQSVDLEQRMLHMERHCRLMDQKLNTLVQSFTSVVHQLTKLKMQSNLQFQMSSEQNRAHDQYVEMMQNTESEAHHDPSSPGALHAINNDKRSDNQQVHQQLDEEFTRVKEWQKKQEKDMQWQQEQVQHWQIQCETQMQDMQQKLTLLEDRQMKFFQETQQKIKQWKDEQPEPAKVESKTPEVESIAKIEREDSKKPQLPPKPSNELLNKAVSPAKASPEDENAAPEAVDFGLDRIADNIASWCSQMELELEELYTNSVESN